MNTHAIGTGSFPHIPTMPARSGDATFFPTEATVHKGDTHISSSSSIALICKPNLPRGSRGVASNKMMHVRRSGGRTISIHLKYHKGPSSSRVCITNVALYNAHGRRVFCAWRIIGLRSPDENMCFSRYHGGCGHLDRSQKAQTYLTASC